MSQSGGVTVGVERVNGTQLTATVQYTTVELADNITIGQLTLQPAKFGVHYTGIAGSLTFPTSAVSDHKPIHCIVIIFCIINISQTAADIELNIIDPELTFPRAFNVTISTSAPQ